MIVHMNYNKGYDQALLDVLLWFDNIPELFKPKEKKRVMFCLRKIWNGRAEFMQDKTEFNFPLSLDDQELFFGKARVQKIKELIKKKQEAV